MLKAFLHDPIDFLRHTVKVLHYVPILKAQNRKSHSFKILCALRIFLHLQRIAMIISIKLNNQFRFCTIKICNIVAERRLSSKAKRIIFQEMIPEFSLRKSHVFS